MTAYRCRRGGEIVYLMPYSERGQRVVFHQDPQTFDTRRRTVDAERARTLAESGRAVSLIETPAWCDPTAPATAHTTAPTP